MTTQSTNNPFKHRWDTEEDADLGGTVDALIRMADRAIATLTMLTCQYDGESSKLNDKLTGNVVFAALHEVEDIRATVKAFYDSSKKAGA